MKHILFGFLTLFIFGQTFVVQAQNDGDDEIFQLNTITTAVPFLVITPDSRSGGMGDVGAATTPDANSFHWNTAKLIFSKQSGEVSLSYTPWLRGLVDDIQLSYLAGYKKIGTKHVFGGSLRYFSLGTINFTDQSGLPIVDFNPNEYEILGGYAFKLSDMTSVGINGKFIYSNLSGQIAAGTATSKPGIGGAADLSFSFVNPDIMLGSFKSQISAGATISNLGNKMAYSQAVERDFIPTNLRLGTALKMNFDSYNSLSAAIDFNKLLVPTLPIRDVNDNDIIISGKENDVGVIAGALQSFYDAPGQQDFDENGDSFIVKNSRLVEELREINIGFGLEYWYSDILAFRSGFFHESTVKGNRKYMTFGAGLKAYSFGLDLSYLVSVTNANPLANTVRFSLSFRFGDNNGTKLGGDSE
ncbi:MAG: type IX secretion system outer membrane channel protein PorV [Crocinitomicaceae bacterium]